MRRSTSPRAWASRAARSCSGSSCRSRCPTIFAGLRIAASSTVGIAGFAFFAGAGGLGGEIFADPTFKGNVVTASLLMILLAAVLELIVLAVQRTFTPWERAVSR